MTPLAADEVTPGRHWTGELLGLTLNLDTIIGRSRWP